jgi:hypothetical protein
MNSKFLIQLSLDEEFYLDSFDGSNYEFTPNRKTAWHMDLNEAERKIKHVHTIFPDAIISEA